MDFKTLSNHEWTITKKRIICWQFIEFIKHFYWTINLSPIYHFNKFYCLEKKWQPTKHVEYFYAVFLEMKTIPLFIKNLRNGLSESLEIGKKICAYLHMSDYQMSTRNINCFKKNPCEFEHNFFQLFA